MQITRSSLDNPTTKGSGEWFTGDVYVDTAVGDPASAQGGLVHFMPGGRTHWHVHPAGQTIFVTEGIGLCQRQGGPIETIHPGDRVYFEPGENHWHGACATRLMVHLAIAENDGEHPATIWGSKVHR